MHLWSELTKYWRTERVPSEINGGMFLSFPFFGEWHLNKDGIYYSGSYMERFWRGTFSIVRRTGWTPRSLLVLGQGIGSSFYAARCVWGDVALTGVDIDPALVDLGPRFYTPDYAHHRSWIRRNSRMSLPHTVMADALEFLRGGAELYDAIALDVFAGNGPAPIMGAPEFIDAVISRCAPGGYILVNINKTTSMQEPWRRALPDIEAHRVQRNTVLIAQRP